MINRDTHNDIIFYKYNPFTLIFNKKTTNILFAKGRYKEDQKSFTLVLILGIVVSLMFMMFDFYRFDDHISTIVYRGGLSVLLAVFIVISGILDPKRPHQLQYFGLLISLLTITVGFMQQTSRADNGLFLCNYISSLIFVSCTIFGLRFRFIVIINLLTLLAYIVYVEMIFAPTTDPIFTQIPQLITYFVIGIIAAYILERQRLSLFIKESQLKQQVRKIDGLNNVKDKLFSTISHDIRGPLVNLRSVTHLFKEDRLSNEELKKLIKGLDTQIGNTSGLIDNLLAWSKTQLDGLKTNKTSFIIKDQLQAIKTLYSGSITEKALKVEIDIDPDDQLYADREMMYIVFRNLISNAIKFTPENGYIKISGHKSNDNLSYELYFKDTGNGMNPVQLKRLFKLDKTTILGNVNNKGAGLGLTLVKEFIDLNSGSVKCFSNEGKGTVFQVSLPLMANGTA